MCSKELLVNIIRVAAIQCDGIGFEQNPRDRMIYSDRQNSLGGGNPPPQERVATVRDCCILYSVLCSLYSVFVFCILYFVFCILLPRIHCQKLLSINCIIMKLLL
jgi:hypothetical protein